MSKRSPPSSPDDTSSAPDRRATPLHLVGDAEEGPTDRSPPGLTPRYAELYQSWIDEVVALRHAATAADMAVLATAAISAQGEAEAREFAAEAKHQGDAKGYLKFTQVAQAEARAKRAALASAGLTGDRRGASKMRRAAFAINSTSAKTHHEEGGRWDGL